MKILTLTNLVNLIYVLSIIGIIVYSFLKRRYSYWRKRGVYSPPCKFPFGNFDKVIYKEDHHLIELSKFYTKDKPCIGIFLFHKPLLVINDMELIKNVLGKDFLYFSDRGIYTDKESSPISFNLVSMEEASWKKSRTQITPIFSPKKLKMVFNTLVEIASNMDEYLENTIGSEGVRDINDLLGNFTTNAFVDSFYGIECNHFQSSHNEFKEMMERLLRPHYIRGFIFLSAMMMPELLNKHITSHIWDMTALNFFLNTAKDSIEHREKKKFVRDDFLQLMIQLKECNHNEKLTDSESKKDHLTTTQLAAEMYIFLAAGIDAVALTGGFLLYELALNPDIQTTVLNEIDEIKNKYGNKFSYDSINEMHYLNNAFEETVRKYPPLPTMTRRCTKNYQIPGSDVVIEKDTIMMVPIYAIHYNADYYPNPTQFAPERFTPENKEKRPQYSNLGYGGGPRNCIGARFGKMQAVLAVATILSKFRVEVCDETVIPMQYDKYYISLKSEKPIKLKMIRRT